MNFYTVATASPDPVTQQTNLEEQARGYELILQQEPNNQTALAGLLNIRLRQGRFEATITPLEKLVELNPNRVEYGILLAQMRQQFGNVEGSVQAYRDVLAIRPLEIRALSGLIYLMVQQNRSGEAISLLQDTLQNAGTLDTQNTGTLNTCQSRTDIIAVQMLLGSIHAKQGQFNEAIAVYNQVIESDRQDFRPVLGKALVLQQQERIKEAKALFAVAASLAPEQFRDQINQLSR
ncbi:MAG: tetratricopeptide repeat protein [Drouetiella hepatica Uher 2000/2452]|uniref:Tetratricopeptide repeat protein n=1 Tax=Drouetiella hepatica Uher 2000/2452 TaxID=904376 RepID=A0A951QCB0_9CYAN|nr:tetratricopeptide repeat protein [Drouetiella hepatica Uher 2000/2452]